MKLKALVVGLGQIGMGYDLACDSDHVLTHARAFHEHSRFKLAAAADSEPERCRLFERTYGCTAYTDIAAALAKTRPDIVAIATPTQLHGEVLGLVLRHSEPRAILCEKPLSFDLGEARAMVDQCASRGCRLYCNYMRRSDPGAIEIRKRLEVGSIGSPVKGVAWYSKGLFNNGSHFFNLLQSWLGDVEGFHIVDSGRLWNGVDPEPDVMVTFSRGTMVFLAAKEENYSHYTIELVAANGRLRYEQGGKRIAWQAAQASSMPAGYTYLAPEEESVPTGMARYQWHVADQIAASLDGGNAEVCSGSEALKTIELLAEIRASL